MTKPKTNPEDAAKPLPLLPGNPTKDAFISPYRDDIKQAEAAARNLGKLHIRRGMKDLTNTPLFGQTTIEDLLTPVVEQSRGREVNSEVSWQPVGGEGGEGGEGLDRRMERPSAAESGAADACTCGEGDLPGLAHCHGCSRWACRLCGVVRGIYKHFDEDNALVIGAFRVRKEDEPYWKTIRCCHDCFQRLRDERGGTVSKSGAMWTLTVDGLARLVPDASPWEAQQARIKAAIAEFPETFGLRGFPGVGPFRLSHRSSYIDGLDQVLLYTEILRDGEWHSFAKGTVSEVRAEVIPFGGAR